MTGGDTDPFPSDKFPYLVLADRLAGRIQRGEFGESRQLPASREIMAHYRGCAPRIGTGVVRHARQELIERGLAHVRQGHGTFVT